MNADRCTAVRSSIDETLRLKDEQGLPNGRAADAELARELLLLQARSGCVPAVHDRLTYHLGDADTRVHCEQLAVLEDLRHGG